MSFNCGFNAKYCIVLAMKEKESWYHYIMLFKMKLIED